MFNLQLSFCLRKLGPASQRNSHLSRELERGSNRDWPRVSLRQPCAHRPVYRQLSSSKQRRAHDLQWFQPCVVARCQGAVSLWKQRRLLLNSNSQTRFPTVSACRGRWRAGHLLFHPRSASTVLLASVELNLSQEFHWQALLRLLWWFLSSFSFSSSCSYSAS